MENRLLLTDVVRLRPATRVAYRYQSGLPLDLDKEVATGRTQPSGRGRR